jgi:heterodisulfide reductase subunit A
MDIRAHGKEFDDYYERAKDEYGIEFTRSRVANIKEDPETKDLTISYVEGNDIKEKTFQLVVLGVGFTPPERVEEFSKVFGINLNKYNFCETNSYTPLETNVPGIYVSGAFSSPKDIPDTVAQASGAAAMASGIISSERWKETSAKEYPPERDVAGEEPKIGVFVCHCGINIGGVVRVPEVVEYAKSLPGVVHAEENLYTCSQDTQERMAERIKELGLNRTIVCSCTPRTHEPLFRNTTAEGGINPYLFEMANIRDQCSWVHMHDPDKATEKSKDLLRMAVAKSRLLEPLNKKYLPITQKGLVVGGGVAGMTAALGIAKQGFETYLIEKDDRLGGNMNHIHYTLNSTDNGSTFEKVPPQEFLKELIEKVNSNDRIKVFTSAKVKNIEGFMGNFKTTIENGGGEQQFDHGVVVIATGAYEYKPKEYLYGENDHVLTQVELEEKLVNNNFDGKDIVMIQCVGSRDENYKWCSRLCCNVAVKNALKLKEQHPESKIYVLYKDIRTYGFKEDFYKKAQEQGVLFINYDDDAKPQVAANGGKLKVTFKDPTSGEDVEIPSDYVVLSAGTHPNEDNEELQKMLKVTLNKYKFFLEAHMKLRPVDFATEGVFLAGLAHGPKGIDESISQAYGAVARAATVLAKDKMEIDPTISFVIDENCDGCAYCVDPCPYQAITLIEYMKNGSVKKTVQVNEAACKGCGVCMATCPKKGIVVKGFRLDQLTAMVDAALGVN